MAKCWERRPCDDEMMARCPHNNPDEKCSARCGFAQCDRPTRDTTSDPALIFDPFVDRNAAMTEQCTYCGFFLKHGPRVEGSN